MIWKLLINRCCPQFREPLRNFSVGRLSYFRVVLIGAYGGIGQATALLLKEQSLITDLVLYDIKHTLGVAADLSHIPTRTKVSGFTADSKLENALKDAQIVLVAAGMPRKPGMTRDDLFETNACVVKDIITQVACVSPKAMVALVTNPLNSTVAVAADILSKSNAYDPQRLFGVTALDVARATTFLAELQCVNPCDVQVPVVGGHSAETIVPLFSQAKPTVTLEEKRVNELIKRVQNAGTEIVEAKKGKGSATLSMAHAAAQFVTSLCRGMKGDKDVVECAMVASDATEARFMANPVVLGKNGIEKNLGFGKLSETESKLLCDAIPLLCKDIQRGSDFVKKFKD